jgi:hypothetical protein
MNSSMDVWYWQMMNDIHPWFFDVIHQLQMTFVYRWTTCIHNGYTSIINQWIQNPSIQEWHASMMMDICHSSWMNQCFPSYIMDDINACMNFIYPWWTDVDCPSKVGMDQSITSMSILQYNMFILWYILCMVFRSELMNAIQSRDNHQYMVLVYFDTLFALGCTQWKCNLKRQPLNLIIYNMTKILLRPNNTNGDEHTKLCLGLARYLEL